MKTMSAALKAHYAQTQTTIATLCKITRTDGVIVYMTNHDMPIVFGGHTYVSTLGFSASNIESSDQLNPDNLEAQGPLLSPLITDSDIHSGVWDYAAVHLSEVNYKDLSMGENVIRDGTLGVLKCGRIQYTVELRGLMQAYTRKIVRLAAADCDAAVGDARCKVDMTPFTVTGAVTGANSTSNVIYDTSRTEPGPSGPISISNISQAQEAVVTATAHGFLSNQTVQFSSIVGVQRPNGDNLNGLIFRVTVLTANTFSIPVDTRSTGGGGPSDPQLVYNAYVSGGLAYPTTNSGYFDYGLITFTSGLNSGLGMEVKAYVPGVMTLRLNMPFAVAIGDTYTMTAGCDNQFNTCKNKFNNIVNFRGLPSIPGNSIYNVGGITVGSSVNTSTPV